MERRAVIACVLYLAFVATLFTDIYEGFSRGEDDSWLLAVLAVGASLGLGAVSRRVWSAALPLVLCGIGFFASSGAGLSWLILILFAPPLVVATLIGWLLGRHAGQAGLGIGVAGYLVAAGIVGIGVADTVDRSTAPRLPQEAARRLPLDNHISNLCAMREEEDPKYVRDLTRRTEALIDELDRRPGHLVTITITSSDSPDDKRVDLTVREFAEEELDLMENAGVACPKDIERRLREAIDAS